MRRPLDERIIALKKEIERRQAEYRNSPAYHGCVSEEVDGMIQALNFITGHNYCYWDADGELGYFE